jgi:uncharacterized membrane protein YraQ (UPF0718 family)
MLGALLRVLQAIAVAAPTVLIGLFVAAVIERLLGRERVARLFGAGTWRALPQAWLLGMLLPVCSLGVIPVVGKLRCFGLSAGVILAFAITAPLFNPLSLLYGLTLSQPLVIFSFAMFSLFVVTLVGLFWDVCFSSAEGNVVEVAGLQHGWRRMLGMLLSAVREAGGPSLRYIVVGLLGVGLLAVALPPGVLQTSAERGDRWAPLVMSAVALPAYITPLGVMGQLGSMFLHGNSVGAAFVLLVLGAGVNLGLIAWILYAYGWRKGSAWCALLIAVVVAIGYACEQPLFAADVSPAGHTHAFDGYCRPFEADSSRAWQSFRQQAADKIAPIDRILIAGWLGLIVAGLIVNRLDPRQQWEASLAAVPVAHPNAAKTSWDREVSPATLGGVLLVGLVAFSVVSCYAYYPAPEECFEEIRLVRVSTISEAIAMHPRQFDHYAPLLEDWTRRFEVGAIIRGYPLNEFLRLKLRICRDRLELLEHAVSEPDAEEAKELALALDLDYSRLRRAFDQHFSITGQ